MSRALNRKQPQNADPAYARIRLNGLRLILRGSKLLERNIRTNIQNGLLLHWPIETVESSLSAEKRDLLRDLELSPSSLQTVVAVRNAGLESRSVNLHQIGGVGHAMLLMRSLVFGHPILRNAKNGVCGFENMTLNGCTELSLSGFKKCWIGNMENVRFAAIRSTFWRNAVDAWTTVTVLLKSGAFFALSAMLALVSFATMRPFCNEQSAI